MYCVIQELQLKKADTSGAQKDLEVITNPFNTRSEPQYGYWKAGERFERPIKKAYKISVHESKRIAGVVTKKQFVVTTVNYYTLAEGWFCLGEYDEKIVAIAEQLNTDADTIYDILNQKISSLEQCIQAEFQKTEEYITSQNHRAIISKYKRQKALFAEKHQCDESEYDFCFNVFGELMNEAYYNKIANRVFDVGTMLFGDSNYKQKLVDWGLIDGANERSAGTEWHDTSGIG